MTKWFLPLAVLGVGGFGLFALSDRGIELLESAASRLRRASGDFLDWNEAAQSELEKIQSALNRVAENLGAIQ